MIFAMERPARARKHEIERNRENVSLRERLASAITEARAIGPSQRDFDMKRFTDDLWGT
jgi:antitoxin VapB